MKLLLPFNNEVAGAGDGKSAQLSIPIEDGSGAITDLSDFSASMISPNNILFNM